MILFLERSQIAELFSVKVRGEDPSRYLMDLIETFYIRHDWSAGL